MEGGLGLHLQSAVRWKDENRHRNWDIMEREKKEEEDERKKRVVKHRGGEKS